MSSKADLKLDWCSYEAAKYAVEHWHYSRKMPVGKLVKIGVWENTDNESAFIGAIIFGLGGGGACNGWQYGLARNFEMAELQRIALRQHATPVSRIISISLKLLHKHCPGLKLIISYADPAQDHRGGVYQAAGWIYTGRSADDWKAVWPNGKEAHSRIARRHVQFGIQKVVDISGAKKVPIAGKFRYLWPLNTEIRARILPLARPYPKRATGETIDTSGDQSEEGGAAPTVALQIERLDRAGAA